MTGGFFVNIVADGSTKFAVDTLEVLFLICGIRNSSVDMMTGFLGAFLQDFVANLNHLFIVGELNDKTAWKTSEGDFLCLRLFLLTFFTKHTIKLNFCSAFIHNFPKIVCV